MEEKDKVTIDELAIMINNGFKRVEDDIEEIKTDLQNVKSQMVTKSFMTDKLIDLKSETTERLKKEDEKVEKIAETLGDRKVFGSEDVKEIKSIEVFAKTAGIGR